VIGCVPDQLPRSAVSVWPSCAVPEIVGAAVLVGAVGAAVTTAVSAELAEVDPALLVAVTRTRMVDPTSAAVTA
jgi:hypothetical protein